VIGLDAAGKTTFLYKVRSFQPALLGTAEIVTPIPVIGFNVETLETKRHTFQSWDIGGYKYDKMRTLWCKYMRNAVGLIFFIDSTDRGRVSDAKAELGKFLKEEELNGIPLLIVANKCDLPDGMHHSEIVESLELNVMSGRSWQVILSCMTSGEGMIEILTWVKERHGRSSPAGALAAAPAAPSQSAAAEAKASSEV
jgi:small GTP-binding protein